MSSRTLDTPRTAAGSSPSAAVAAGGTANFVLSFAPQGGLAATVNLSCSGAPAKSTCTVNPASVVLDGTNPASATVTVKTTASSFTAPVRLMRKLPPDFPAKRVPLLLLLLTIAAVAGLLRARAPSRESRAPLRLCFAALLLTALLFLPSCGGGGGSTPTGPSNPGTPAGSYLLTVTATTTSGTTTLTQTQTLNLHVN